MSSVLLLLLVLGWIVFLVPLLAHRSGPATEVRSADSFATAMRVLSRRSTPAGAAAVVVPARPEGATGAVLSGTRRRGPSPTRLTQLRRRRRTLAVLVALMGVATGGLLAGMAWALPVLLVAATVLAACLVHLRRAAARAQQEMIVRRRAQRRAAITRAQQEAREALLARPDSAVHPAYGAAVVQIPVYAETVEAELPATGTDNTWTPAPIPPPTYVTAVAASPAHPRRVVDLTRPGAWSAAAGYGPESSEDEPADLGEELLRRRAVGA